MSIIKEPLSVFGRNLARFTAASLLLAGLGSVQRLAALTVTAVTSDNGYPAHEIQWMDSAGLPRTAIMVDQNMTTAPYTGYLRRYTYQVNGVTRTCTGTQNYATGGDLEFSGDGFVQNHTAGGGDFSTGNGTGFAGTTTIKLTGSDHAIVEYDIPNYTIYGPYYDPENAEKVPTSIQWFFADGRDNPIFAISQDARNAGGNLGADSRSPYGDMAYDGDGTDAYVGGCSYGDTFKFVTLAANEVTTNSGWSYNQANTIPYAMQWANPATVDAEMGHVATLPITVSDQGLDSQVYNFTNNSLGNQVYDGNNPFNSIYGDYRSLSGTAGPMIPDAAWAFQILNDNWPASGPTTTKRLTWGSNWGRLGGYDDGYYGGSGTPDNQLTNFTQHATEPVGNPVYPNYKSPGNSEDGTMLAYSVFVVFGTHTGGYTNGTVGKMVVQMQNETQATLAATLGTVATSGPAGIGNATNRTITYTPAGYDPTYASWDITAKTNAVNATLTVSTNYPLNDPVFVINNYTNSQLPGSIAVGTGLTNAGVNYFASLDTNGSRLFITVNRVVTNTLNLVVGPLTGGGGGSTPAPVITSFSPTNGAVGASVVITGSNFTGATNVAFNGTTASFTVNSATQITATVPSAATTGTIAVATPGGTATSVTNFTVILQPSINGYPSSGYEGTSVTITGQNLTGATAVDFNGNPAASFTVNSSTQITATLPDIATFGLITVVTPGGTAYSISGFTIIAPPTISSIPASGSAGMQITISGQNFNGVTNVAFNGVSATFTYNSPTQITATVPAGATSGYVTVFTPDGMGQSTTSFTVIATSALAIYVDSLVNGFEDYSWATNVNDENTSPVYSGSDSISVTAAPYTALSIYHADFSTAPFASLSFWINGGPEGAAGLQVMGVTNVGTSQYYASIYNLPVLLTNAWQNFTIPLSALGVAEVTNCQGFWFWPTAVGATTFYVDAIQLNYGTGPKLAITRAGTNVIITWPATATGFTLQSSSTLNQASWSTVSPAPAVVNGQFTVTNAIGSMRTWYRLSQ